MSERIEIKAQIAADDVGVVSGIAWPFSPDSVGDVIEKGAFPSRQHYRSAWSMIKGRLSERGKISLRQIAA